MTYLFKVIDACLGAIAEAETDKGNKVYKMVTSTMTSILDRHCLQKMHLRDVCSKSLFAHFLVCFQFINE